MDITKCRLSLTHCLTVVCLELTREQKGLESPKLARWKTIYYLEVKRSRLPGQLMLRLKVRHIF